MIKVWHAPDLSFTEPALYPAEYALVAEVVSDEPDEAFGLTNHIDSDWKTNRGVTPTAWVPVRSTSVGDVLELSDGRHLLIIGIGFTEITPNKHVFRKTVTNF